MSYLRAQFCESKSFKFMLLLSLTVIYKYILVFYAIFHEVNVRVPDWYKSRQCILVVRGSNI